jgi:hypothetical protein
VTSQSSDSLPRGLTTRRSGVRTMHVSALGLTLEFSSLLGPPFLVVSTLDVGEVAFSTLQSARGAGAFITEVESLSP